MSEKKHISFSEMKYWNFCPYYHKLVYIDGIKGFTGNIFTAFGTALHAVCEKVVLKEVEEYDSSKFFVDQFVKELTSLDETPDDDSIEQFMNQGLDLAPIAIPELKKKFGEFEIIGVEERLYEPIEDMDYNFKGFIDLVIKTTDGKYHIIDWKSCSWGWDSRKKTDPMVVYQLVLYKNFFAQKYGIDLDKIEAHFALLKRTAKNNKVEFIRTTTGKKRMKNSIDLLNKSVYNIKKKNHFKNRLKCSNCEFNHTEHCKR